MNPNSTCDLCDLYRDDSSGQLAVLPPLYRHYGGRQRFAGPVATLKCLEDNALLKTTLEGPRHGRVLVVDGAGSLRRALVGGNIAALAAQNGWAGLVVHGAVRDSAELAATELGVCALALVPLPPVKRGEGQVDVPLNLHGLWICPGQWLVADEDGIVVLQHKP